MASRMDKYRSDSTQFIQSRSQKNEHLYENLYTNKILTEFTEVDNNNVVELNDISTNTSVNKRENFQKNRALYLEKDNKNKKIEFVSKYNSEEDPTEKNYNINDILNEARKNRNVPDELEKKRHLKTVEYNILSDLSQEKLKVDHNKQKLSEDEEKDLEELINTITSNSLRKRIDDELLSDLLPSKESETLVSKQLLEEIEEATEEDTSEHQIDQSFYTKSMDLSEEDFEGEEEEEDRSFLEGTKMNMSIKIVIILFSLIVLGIIGYVICRFI